MSSNDEEKLMHEFAEHIPQVFWKATLNFKKVLFASNAYEKIWGKSLKALYENPKEWFASIVPKERENVLKIIENLSLDNRSATLEYRIKVNGEYANILDSIIVIQDEQDNTPYLIGVATDITQHKKSEKRILIQHRVSNVLSEAKDFKEAMSKILKLICKNLGWAYGELWSVSPDRKELKWELSFGADTSKLKLYQEVSSKITLPIGIGLPGQALQTKKAEWIENVKEDEGGFTRAFAAKKAGLYGVCAFPIIAEGEVLGVMEFYSENILPKDYALLDVLMGLGEQIGQFSKRKQAEAQLDHMAYHDTLTGLANRSLLVKVINDAISTARKKGENIAVLFLDLDRFKHINDTFGHEVGDSFLKIVGERLESRVRKQDTVARIGGDEFVIILSAIKQLDTVRLVSQKILDILAKPFNVQGQDLFITTSIGISIFPNDGQESKTLLGKADIAMYKAKELGGNNYQLTTPELTEIAREKANIEIDMHHALEKQEFILYYQPKINLQEKKIVGVEALLHWNRNGKIVGPKDFLPFSEETGLIVPIGEWVLKTACRQAKTWLDMGFPISMAVNLSSRQLLFEQILETIRRTLKETELPEQYLDLEITESMLMKKTEESIALIKALRNLNIQISIDDFGTGYSSLMYLKRFVVDRLKIDRSFIQGLGKDKSDLAIAKTIIALAHSMSLKVVAEGVENGDQLRYLNFLHCDEVQGYYFSRPLPEKEMTRYLKSNKFEEQLKGLH